MGAFAVGEKNKALNAITGRSNYTASAGVWAKLHTGAPGSAGTSNAATETTRQQVTFGSDASAGSIASTASLTWTAVNTGGTGTTETITHVSFWSASTSGTFLGSDDLATSKVINNGDDATIASGAVSLALND